MLYLLFCNNVGEGLVEGVFGLVTLSDAPLPFDPLSLGIERFESECGSEDGAVEASPEEPSVEDDFVACGCPLGSPLDSLEDEEASLRKLAFERRFKSLKKGIA